MLTKEFKGTIYVILSGILYGFLSYFGISLIDKGFSLLDMLFWRLAFSSLFLLITLAPYLRETKLPVKIILKAVSFGSIFYASSSVLYFMSCDYINSGLAMVIFFIYPGLVAILNWFLYKAKITKIYFASFALISLGIILLTDLSDVQVNLCGILLAILSGLTYAIYLILSKRQFSKLSPLVGSLTVSIGSSIIVLVFQLLNKGSLIVPLDASTLIYCISNGFISTALPMVLMLVGLKYISSTKASILSVAEPVFTVICGCVLLEEILSLQQIIGIIIVLTGSLIICKNDPHAKIDSYTSD